jgi:polysaccharide export outer membrane protein
MRPKIFIFLFSGLLFILASCSYKQDHVLFEKQSPIPDSNFYSNSVNISNYRIKPQDILQIINIQSSKNIIDLTIANNGVGTTSSSQQGENYQVDDDGTIALTGLGRVKIAGLTRVEARKVIEKLYGGKYLTDPLLEVKIVNLKISIFGEVRQPGNFMLTKDRTTLIEVIGEAGGLTDKADEKTIKIIRSNRKPEIIDLSDIKSLYDPRIILQNDDIVYISQNRRALRDNNIQNFSTVVQPALIIFNTALIIFSLTR